MAGCSIEKTHGSQSYNKIRRDLCDEFNKLLEKNAVPGQEPLVIREVLFKEFVIQ